MTTKMTMEIEVEVVYNENEMNEADATEFVKNNGMPFMAIPPREDIKIRDVRLK